MLGGVAGLTFIVVLSNTDRSDATRIVVLSFLAGLAWQPIINAGVSLVSGQEEQRQLTDHVEAVTQLTSANASRALAASTDEKTAGEAQQDLALASVPDASSLRPALRNALGALYSGVADDLPEDGAEALRETLGQQGIPVEIEPQQVGAAVRRARRVLRGRHRGGRPEHARSSPGSDRADDVGDLRRAVCRA